MKFFLASLLLVSSFQTGHAKKKESAETTELCQSLSKPNGLTVEYLREPRHAKIVDSSPELSWMLPAEASVQTAYEVLVSSSKELLAINDGDVWSSDKVMSSQSSDVEVGVTLKEQTTYFWKVRYYDANYKASAYSDMQEFVTGTFGDKLTSQNVFQTERLSPVESKKLDDGTVFIDFGKAAFAALEFDYKTKKSEVLTVRVGEKLLNGRIDQKPGGTIKYQEIKLEVKPGQTHYKVPIVADERNTNHLAIQLPDSFPVLIPYRYVEVVGASKKFDASKVVQDAYFTYFDYTSSSFTSSDDILNQVWDLCKYTMKGTSFSGYYVDGERERIPYEADAYLNQLSHYSVDNEYAIARMTIEYFFVSKPTWPTEWQLHVPMMVYQDYMYTGNTELIAKYYENMKVKTLMELEVEDGFISTKSPKHDTDLIIRLGFPDTTRRLKDIVDWPPKAKNFGGQGPIPGEQDNYVFKPVNTVVNAFYYHNMMLMAEFAKVLNKPTEALDFEYRAARVKKSINEQLFDEANGRYVDGIGTDHAALHANMMMLAFDAVPESRKASVVAFVKSRGMVCSVYGAQYLMEALYNAGEDVYAHELMSATHDRSWYNMIKIGSTMTLEAWDMKYKCNGDYNHAWGAVPANSVARGMWGIIPKTPGFGVATVFPQMGTLTSSSIVVPTIKGQIKGEFEKVSDKLTTYDIELPGNMPAELKLKLPQNAIVKINGETVSLAFDFVRLLPGVSHIEVISL